MSALLIKNIPAPLHRKLKRTAAQHHRSMNREAIALWEEALNQMVWVKQFPAPFKARLPLTDKILRQAKRERR